MGKNKSRTTSKRMPLRKKYKILKKVKEHHRKLRKAMKLYPGKKLKKDPGIPNLWPFKEEMLKKMKEQRELEEQQEALKRMTKKERREQNRLLRKKMEDEMGLESVKTPQSSISQMAKMQLDAARKAAEFEHKESMMQTDEEDGVRVLKADALSGNSKRAYYREFKKVVEAADVIIEVLDARDPMGCRCPDIEKTIMSMDKEKKIVLLLNKIDLVPREAVEKWLKYFRAELPTLAFKASTQNQKSNLSQQNLGAAEKASKSILMGMECVGADTLIQLLKNYSRSRDMKKAITVGIIGYPNVGKSSVINSLKRSKVVSVGPTPGLTKNAQEIHLDKNIKLLDCPGIIFSSGNLDSDIILRNAVKIEQLEDPITPVEIILKRCSKEKLMETYRIGDYKSVEDFLSSIARNRGMLKKGGVPDNERVARQVLQDWNRGKISFFTLPPQQSTHFLDNFGAASNNNTSDMDGPIVVSGWAKEFKFDDIVKQEEQNILSSLPSMSTYGSSFVPMAASAYGTYRDQDDDDDSDEDMDDDDYESGEEVSDDDDDDDDEMDDDDENDVPMNKRAPQPKRTPASSDAYDFAEDYN